MDVQLYVYDLSQGLARQFSQALTGVQIDAIYHTAIVLNHVEYFFGQGIHRKIPGTTHHGQPMSVVNLGMTDLPLDVIDEYIESLEEIYTPESYNLFLHNCNNFTQDLAMFLVGKSIPDEIRSLPETFLNTPIGQMLRGQIDQSMREMTQAPDAFAGHNASNRPAANRSSKPLRNGTAAAPTVNGTTHKGVTPAIINAPTVADSPGHVNNITSMSELDTLLSQSALSCAVIFFTSATCPPCKIVYPTYDELASEAGTQSGAKLIKIDISASPAAHAVAQRYQVRATPTFITFLRGQKQDEWSGANPAQLQGNVRLLLQMAKPPQHQHTKLRLPSFQRIIDLPILYNRAPPLDKLLAKLGTNFSQGSAVQDLVNYIRTRETKGMSEAALPNLHSFSAHLATQFPSLPKETHFAVIDLVRISAVDPRVSSFLVTEPEHLTLSTLLETAVGGDFSTEAYNIQSVSLQLACNLFSSNIFQEQIFGRKETTLKEMTESMAAKCLLSPHINARSMAAALVYNLASHAHNARMHNANFSTLSSSSEAGADEVSSGVSDDLSAALLESITSLTSVAPSGSGGIKESLHALLLALGMLLYAAPPDDMLWDLCRAMELTEVLKTLGAVPELKAEPLLKEVGNELLGRGGF